MSDIELHNVAKLITKGTTPSSIGCNFTTSGINFVKSESINDSKYLNDLIFEHIDKETDEKLKRSRLEAGDLLFSIAGAYLGKIAIVRKNNLPANTNQAVGIVRLKKEIANSDYVYYYFSQKHINKYINMLSSQSSQPNLNLDLLGKLKFKLRSIDEQKKIAAVLSSLDDKIELNNRINSELENLAKTIYDYWFVQFDFPDENGKPYKS
ncbi:MAG: restriction endonuclease subunit S, partial [Dolichospermum sp.]